MNNITLRELRVREGLSQKDLGEILELPQRRISNYELGVYNAPPEVAEKIRDIFGLTTEEMWDMLYRNAS